MWRHKWIAVVGAAVAVGACREPTTGPSTPAALAFSASPSAACPTPANFVVSDEAGLLAAVAAASPGQVIGVSGNVSVSVDVVISTPGITLTCASAGAGLTAQASVIDMVNALASGVSVERLVLDGSNAQDGPFVALNDTGARFVKNRVTCGPGICALFSGTPGAVVADNQFVSNGSETGVHMQRAGLNSGSGNDGARVERNTVIATAPSGGPQFGGLRIRDGIRVIVAGNVVVGPWQNSAALTDLSRSLVTLNRLQGALVYGILSRANVSFLGPVSMSDNLFLANRISGAGSAGIFFRNACRNTFAGNNLQGNPGNMGLIFDVTTGANVYLGNPNVVVDNGAFDCDGDGDVDPNFVPGHVAVAHAVSLSRNVSDAVAPGSRLQ